MKCYQGKYNTRCRVKLIETTLKLTAGYQYCNETNNVPKLLIMSTSCYFSFCSLLHHPPLHPPCIRRLYWWHSVYIFPCFLRWFHWQVRNFTACMGDIKYIPLCMLLKETFTCAWIHIITKDYPTVSYTSVILDDATDPLYLGLIIINNWTFSFRNSDWQ